VALSVLSVALSVLSVALSVSSVASYKEKGVAADAVTPFRNLQRVRRGIQRGARSSQCIWNEPRTQEWPGG
jgi:hypothetical protein